MMNLSDTMGPYKTSTMLDLKNRNPMEVRSFHYFILINLSSLIITIIIRETFLVLMVHNKLGQVSFQEGC